MKIATEYYGPLNVRVRYDAIQIRHNDRRKGGRRQMIVPIEIERRSITDRRVISERRSILRPSWGIIYVYGYPN